MRFIGALWGLLVLAVGGAIAWFAYNAGVAQGLATSGHLPAGVTYTYPDGGGWGFVPLLFFLFFLVLLIRGAGRRHRHWGYWHGPWGGGWYGGQPGQPGQSGPLPPPIDQRMRAWHDGVHGNAPAGGDQPA